MRAQAEKLEAKAAPMLARAKQLRSAADVIERAQQHAASLLGGSGLPLVADNATITQPMEAQKVISSSKGRPGRKFARPGPFATAAENSGKTMGEIAEILGEPEGTVKSWNSRRRAPQKIRDKLAKKPFLVPEADWIS